MCWRQGQRYETDALFLQVPQMKPPTSFRAGLAGTGVGKLLDDLFRYLPKRPCLRATPLSARAAIRHLFLSPAGSWIYAVNSYRNTANTTTIYQALYSSWPCIALLPPRRAPSLSNCVTLYRICRRQRTQPSARASPPYFQDAILQERLYVKR
jgi:hypothetical protein